MNLFREPLFIYIVVFAAIVLPIAFYIFSREEQPSLPGMGKITTEAPSVLVWLAGTAGLLELALGEPLVHLMPGRAKQYERAIHASGMNLSPENKFTPAKLFAMKVITALIAAGVGALLYFAVPEYRGPMMAAWLFLVFVGWVYPSMKLDSYVQWRQNEITKALPFAIDLISSAMRAGLDFGAAMRYYENLMIPGPLTDEFGEVLKDVELGKSRVEALNDMAGRVQTDSFASFAGVVAYGTEIGASISETLRVQGEEMRRARFHIAERKAARAPSLMIFPLAVFILPAVFIIIIVPVMMQMSAAGAQP